MVAESQFAGVDDLLQIYIAVRDFIARAAYTDEHYQPRLHLHFTCPKSKSCFVETTCNGVTFVVERSTPVLSFLAEAADRVHAVVMSAYTGVQE